VSAGAPALGAAARPLLWAFAGLAALVAASLSLAVLLVLAAGSGLGDAGPDEVTSPAALADISAHYLALYRAAADRAGLDWAVLAAIGKIESDHGRSPLPGVRAGLNSYGCCAGPMQFNITNGPPSTWDLYATDGDGDGAADAYDPADAIPAAARYLLASGAPADYRRAVYAYNHSWAYVDQVLAQAARYRAGAAEAAALGALDGDATQAGPGQLVFPVRGPGGAPTGSFSDDYRSPRAGGGQCPDHPTWHCATDIFAPRNTAVVAPIAGRLIRVGLNAYGGNRLWVEGPSDRFYLAHLDAYARGVREGLAVPAGALVGYVGDTGSARGTPTHLHIAWEHHGPAGWANADPYRLLAAASARGDGVADG